MRSAKMGLALGLSYNYSYQMAAVMETAQGSLMCLPGTWAGKTPTSGAPWVLLSTLSFCLSLSLSLSLSVSLCVWFSYDSEAIANYATPKYATLAWEFILSWKQWRKSRYKKKKKKALCPPPISLKAGQKFVMAFPSLLSHRKDRR